MLLEDVVRAELNATSKPSVIVICGPPGCGKSTAARYLYDRLKPDFEIEVAEDRSEKVARPRTESGLHRCTLLTAESDVHCAADSDVRAFQICEWGQDDLIEYLLSVSPQACGSVMERLTDDADIDSLNGSPFLWSLVLDRMIADDAIINTRRILRTTVDELLETLTSEARSELGKLCRDHALIGEPTQRHTTRLQNSIPEARLTRFPPIRLYLGASHVVSEVTNAASKKLWRIDQATNAWSKPWPTDFLHEVCDLSDASFVDRLKSAIARKKNSWIHPIAASLLVRLEPGWRPENEHPLNLRSAELQSVQWPSISFAKRKIGHADFSNANLSGSDFSNNVIDGVGFEQANLTGANFVGSTAKIVRFDCCDFEESDLSIASLLNCSMCNVNAQQTLFKKALLFNCRMKNSNFHLADFRGAEIQDCDLSGVLFSGAKFIGARIVGSNIDGADFTNATFEKAQLAGCLNTAEFGGAIFPEANLRQCNLEDMKLHAPVFCGANLSRAQLTGTYFPNADFCNANLTRCGLAEIEWEGADLRGANLQGSTFHLGTTRSGMLNSPIASEGTRTGFYTDSWHEQNYKPVEEIRKANLRGADLREANLDGVDFYLVDLRDAQYDTKYQKHLVKCGAIL